MKQELPNWNMVGGILEHSAVQLTFELNTDVSAGILFEESPCCQEFFLLWFIIIWKQARTLQIWYRAEQAGNLNILKKSSLVDMTISFFL